MTLVSSVTSAVPVHVMQSNVLPAGTLEKLDKLNRGFLWGSTSNAQKIHLLPWDVVCKQKGKGGAGIRSMRDMNSVLLMKLLWRLWKEPDSLWASVLSAKYRKDVIFGGEERIARNRSHLWKSIHSIYDDFTRGLVWSIGDDKTTAFWEDKWMEDFRLCDLAIRPIEVDHLNCKVADFIDDSNGWKWEILESYFDESILLRFHSLICLRDSDIRDMPRWCNANNGIFNCKSAYEFITSDPDASAVPDSFARIWKLKVPQRHKSFGWLCLHNRILTNAERRRRHLTTDSMCSRCNNGEETIAHALRDCYFSSQIWKDIIPQQFWNSFFAIDSVNWFKTLFDKSDGDFGINGWKEFFLISTASLWDWRNKSLFQSDFVFPSTGGEIIRGKALENVNCWQFQQNSNRFCIASKPRTESWLFWRRPPAGFWKLNTDGSRSEDGLISAGGLIRDSSGDWVVGFMNKIGSGSSFEAEIWGLISGLNLASEVGARNLEIESDCAEIVTFVKGLCPLHHPARALIRQVQILLQKFEVWSISHVFREMNRSADFLARKASNCSLGLTKVPLPPHDMAQLLRDDYQGVSLPRLIAT